jgi:hypothetical protein
MLLIYDTSRYKDFHSAENVPDLTHYVKYYGYPSAIYKARVNNVPYYGLRPDRGRFFIMIATGPIFLYKKSGELWDYNLNPDDADFEIGGFSPGLVKWEGEVEHPEQVIKKLMSSQ